MCVCVCVCACVCVCVRYGLSRSLLISNPILYIITTVVRTIRTGSITCGFVKPVERTLLVGGPSINSRGSPIVIGLKPIPKYASFMLMEKNKLVFREISVKNAFPLKGMLKSSRYCLFYEINLDVT